MQPHVPTCLCPLCERTSGGDFAVRAYAEGEKDARARLSHPVANLLPSLIVEQSAQEAA